MRCRAWETRHVNGKTYIHVVDENLTAEILKDLSERIAKSPIEDQSKFPIQRDVAGSYLLAEKGHESISFSAFVPFDSHILDDFKTIKDALQVLVSSNQVSAKALLMVMDKLGIKAEE